MKFLKKIYHGLEIGSNIINIFTKLVVMISVFGCFLMVFLQVVNRYILVKQTLFQWTSISWTDEAARYFLVLTTYAALGLCFKDGHMARVDMLYTRIKSEFARKLLYIVESIIMLIFTYVIIKFGVEYAIANSIYTSDMLRIPGYVLYMIPPIGMVLVGYEIILDMVGVMSGERKAFGMENIRE